MSQSKKCHVKTLTLENIMTTFLIKTCQMHEN